MERYHQMISKNTGKYFDMIYESGKDRETEKFKNRYSDSEYIVNLAVYDFKKKGLELDAFQIKNIIRHKNSRKRERYWNLYQQTDGTAKVTYYYHKINNIYSLVRSDEILFDIPPEVYDFGNCTVIVNNSNGHIDYLANYRRLFYVVRHGNDYIGYSLEKIA